jgi:ribonuclease R
VAELVASGRGAAVRPAFEPGDVLPIGKAARREADVGDLVAVSVRGRSPRVVEVFGPARSPHAALRALLDHEGLARPFPRAALEEAQAHGERTPLGDAGRRDLRAQRVITIDPEGAKDHDDAIAVAPEGDDATRLWVHIADVSRFVAPGGALDREAARRGNSVYVPGHVVPMLPPDLSTDLCSLRPGADRAALTAEIVIGPGGETRETRFHRSLIRSERRLTYPEVDAFIAGESLGDPPLEEEVARAARLAESLRRRRMQRGALEAHSGEPVVRFSGDRIAAMHLEGQTPAHSLVEECMIAANEAVARFLIAKRTPALFRHHEDPAQARVEMLYAQLEALEVATPPLPGGPLAPSQCREAAAAAAGAVARHLAAGGGGGEALWGLVLRSLRQAHYTPAEPAHSGLASSAYLHFTSPIRRYPDLLVHRGLLDALGVGGAGPGAAELGEAGEHCSGTEREAAAVERRADDICAAYWLSDLLRERPPGTPVHGRISGLIDAGLFVTFDELFTGFLPSRALRDDHYLADPLGVMLVGERTGRRMRIGQEITVVIDRIEPLRGRVSLLPGGAAGGGAPVRALRRRR